MILTLKQKKNKMPRLWATGTDLMYIGSEDQINFTEANGRAVQLPVGADADDDGDVIFTRKDLEGPAALGVAPKITTDRFGHPIIQFSQKKIRDVQGPGWNSGNTYAQWDGSQWNIHTSFGPEATEDPSVDGFYSDFSGVVSVINWKYMYRLWDLNGEFRRISYHDLNMPHGFGKLADSFMQQTGDLLGRSFNSDTQELTVYRVRITRPTL